MECSSQISASARGSREIRPSRTPLAVNLRVYSPDDSVPYRVRWHPRTPLAPNGLRAELRHFPDGEVDHPRHPASALNIIPTDITLGVSTTGTMIAAMLIRADCRADSPGDDAIAGWTPPPAGDAGGRADAEPAQSLIDRPHCQLSSTATSPRPGRVPSAVPSGTPATVPARIPAAVEAAAVAGSDGMGANGGRRVGGSCRRSRKRDRPGLSAPRR